MEEKGNRSTARFPFLAATLVAAVFVVIVATRFAGAPSNSVSPEQSLQDDAELQAHRIRNPGSSIQGSDGRESTTDLTESPAHSSISANTRKRTIISAYQVQRAAKPARARKEELVMPEWDKIILPGGNLRDDVGNEGEFGSNGLPDFVDLYSGVEAQFIEEIISNGIATDMSALLIGGELTDEILYNGAVRAEHDLGYAYVLATIASDGHLRLYAGVERLMTNAGTFIEFEFTEDPIRLAAGSPWPLQGQRNDGDIMVRMVFSDQALQSVQIESWSGDDFQFVDSSTGVSGNNCLEAEAYMYCVGVPPVRHPDVGLEIWDEEFNSVDQVIANGFVEVGIDVDRLVGEGKHITSILMRTPEDIALSRFKVFDRARLALATSIPLGHAIVPIEGRRGE